MTTARAGWAEVDITPPPGLPLGGRGPKFALGDRVEEPLRAHVLLLEDGAGRRTLWASFDLIGLQYDAACRLRFELAAWCGVAHEAVILNFSHTHSGPMAVLDEAFGDPRYLAALRDYVDVLCRKVLLAAGAAQQQLQPVTLTQHRGRSDVGINRRGINAEGIPTHTPDPRGVYIPGLWVLDVRAADGAGRCLVYAYSCHPVATYAHAPSAVSSDFVGVARRHLRARLGEGVQCQFVQGFGGNIRPRILADVARNVFRMSTPDDVEQAGATFAADVLAALDTPGAPLTPAIAAAEGWFPALRDLAKVPPLAFWQEMAAKEDELSRHLGGYWLRRMQHGPPPVAVEPWGIGLLRLARGCTVAWLMGEVLAEWHGHLCRWLNDDQLVPWGYCQGTTSWYLPTDELLPQGGYEVDSANMYAPTGPGPLAHGLNEAARRKVLALQQQLDVS